MKTPVINLVMNGCWPAGTPSVLINNDNEDRTVSITLYPTPLWHKSYKNNKIWFIVISKGLTFISLQNSIHFNIKISYLLLVPDCDDWTITSAISLRIFCSWKHLLTHKKPSTLFLGGMELTFSYMSIK